jgi:ribosomal protein L37AE/L43A
MTLIDFINKSLGELKEKDPEEFDRISTQQLHVCPECGNNDIFNANGDWYCESCGSIDIEGD